jgi:hypothetical protein
MARYNGEGHKGKQRCIGVTDIMPIYSGFRIPHGERDEFEADGYDRPATESFCQTHGTRCPFSLLQYLLL